MSMCMATGAAGGESTYGLRTFTGQYATAKTSSGQSYRVDNLKNRAAVGSFATNAANSG